MCSLEDDQKEKSLSHHTIQQLIIEKDQALADLNSVEKSLADLFRRYEKMKDVLEGFRKVTLKTSKPKCPLSHFKQHPLQLLAPLIKKFLKLLILLHLFQNIALFYKKIKNLCF